MKVALEVSKDKACIVENKIVQFICMHLTNAVHFSLMVFFFFFFILALGNLVGPIFCRKKHYVFDLRGIMILNQMLRNLWIVNMVDGTSGMILTYHSAAA